VETVRLLVAESAAICSACQPQTPCFTGQVAEFDLLSSARARHDKTIEMPSKTSFKTAPRPRSLAVTRSPKTAILASAPCRADLAGGTIDLWPLYLFHSGAMTLNFALNVRTSCRIEAISGKGIHLLSLDTGVEDRFADLRAFLAAKIYRHSLAAHVVRFFSPFLSKGGFRLETHSESPAGAGISGSSALMIATTAALARLSGRKLGLEQIRVIAQNIEAQIIQVPTGCQDYYPALYGGVSAIYLREDGIQRKAVAVDPREIESRFVLAYTGAPRKSGINNWEVFQAHINGDKRVHRNFDEIARIAGDMHRALIRGDWNAVAGLLREEWKLRRTNAPGITTPLIDKLIAAASRHGCLAAKVCGAGGGGCVIFQVKKGSRAQVEQAIAKSGGQVIPLAVARKGLDVRMVHSTAL